MDDANYLVYIFHENCDEWAVLIKEAFKNELHRFNINDTINIEEDLQNFNENLLKVKKPSICIYLGTIEGRDSSVCQDAIESTLSRRIPIIPVVRDLSKINECLPKSLCSINAFLWNGESSAETLIRRVLEILGLTEKDRKVFICYRRSEGLKMANQLFDNLSSRGFKVFLDRFDIKYGLNFNEEIIKALEEIAFLIVIESPEAYGSDGVLNEVMYALKHNMGLVFIRWPTTVHSIPNTRSLPRINLTSDELESVGDFCQISSNRIDQIANELEFHHAKGLYLRKHQIIDSLITETLKSFPNYETIKSWVLLFKNEESEQKLLLGITPRLPLPIDLYQLDKISRGLNSQGTIRTILVHSSENIPNDHRNLLEWIQNGHDLEFTTHEDFIREV